MNLSDQAKNRLNRLLPKNAGGFSVTNFVGTCRGSTPAIKPVNQAEDGQLRVACDDLIFFVNVEIAERFQTCNLDYDGSFMGKGLIATWPQCDKCACDS